MKPMGIGAGISAQPPQQAANDNGMDQASPDNEASEATPDDEQAEGEGVSPEEQAQYDQFVKNGLSLIYPANAHGQISPVVINHLKGNFEEQAQQELAKAQPPISNNPIDNLAASTVLLVMALQEDSHGNDNHLDSAIVLHGGAELLGELGHIATKAKIHEYQQDEINNAMYRGMDIYRAASPYVNVEAAKEDFAQLDQAEKNGTLEQLIPELFKGQPASGAGQQAKVPPAPGQMQSQPQQ
jgi:hypothetical protein